MRVRFAPVDSQDGSTLRRALANADAFFAEAVARLAAFEKSVPASAGDVAALEQRLTMALDCVAPGLVAEVDASEGLLRVVLSPSRDSGLDPLVAEVLRRAPASADLSFERHLGEQGVETAVLATRDRFGLDLSDARLRIGFSRGHLLEVVVTSSRFSSAADDRGLLAANCLVSRLIGTELFDDWIGAVDVAPGRRPSSLNVVGAGPASDAALTLLRLEEALPAVEAAIRGVYAELPSQPCRTTSARAGWTLFEAEPGIDVDYPAQDDVALASTRIPEAVKCFLEGARFSSKRFSRLGEVFAYVKIDAHAESAARRHALKDSIETVLDTALVSNRVGCVIGSGLGVRYVYVHVALEHLEHGVRVSRCALREREVHRRAWILFFDDVLSHEWVGVWDDTPPPPER